jgi:hypothetical protein
MYGSLTSMWHSFKVSIFRNDRSQFDYVLSFKTHTHPSTSLAITTFVRIGAGQSTLSMISTEALGSITWQETPGFSCWSRTTSQSSWWGSLKQSVPTTSGTITIKPYLVRVGKVSTGLVFCVCVDVHQLGALVLILVLGRRFASCQALHRQGTA